MITFNKSHGLLLQGISRKELLRYVAIAIIGLLGVAGLLQSLNGAAVSTATPKDSQNAGYSSSVYGR